MQKQLDQYSIGFSASESGIEIEMLKEMFTDAEAAMFTAMTGQLETPEAVAERLGKSAEELAVLLEEMAAKGLLFRKRERGSILYSAIPFIHGLLEFQIDRADRNIKKIIKMAGKYINERLAFNMAENTDLFMRTIPVQSSLTPDYQVASYEDAVEILKAQQLIVLTDCACRKQKSFFGKDCGRPMEVCLMFGAMGEYYLDNGLGREIGLEEAIQIERISQEASLVTQTSTAIRPFMMCHCCVCCCGFLRPASLYPNPADLIFSNHSVKIDTERCSGCGECEAVCGMEAARLTAAGVAEIDCKRCIGCGLCVHRCPAGACTLIPRADKKTPPPDTPAQMRAIARKRGMARVDPANIVSFGF